MHITNHEIVHRFGIYFGIIVSRTSGYMLPYGAFGIEPITEWAHPIITNFFDYTVLRHPFCLKCPLI